METRLPGCPLRHTDGLRSLGSFFSPLGRFLVYSGVKFAGVGRAHPLASTSPLFGTVLAILLIHEIPTAFTALGMLVVVAGAALVASEKARVMEEDSIQAQAKARREIILGSVAAVMGAVCYGGANTVSRYIVTRLTVPLVATLFALMFGALFLSVIAARDVIRDRHVPRIGFAMMGLSGLAGAGGVTFLISALNYAPVAVVSPLVGIVPLLSLPMAHYFLHRLERITVRLWIGSILVVAGITALTWNAGQH